MVAGPLLAGLCVARWDWRAVFLGQAAVALAMFPVGARVLPRSAGRRRRLDVWGQVALGAAFAGLVFGVTELADQGFSVSVIAAGAVFVLGALGAVLVERWVPAPLLDPGVFRNRAFLGVLAQGVLFNFVFFGLLFALGMVLQGEMGVPVATSAAVMTALTGAVMAGNLASGWLAGVARSSRALLGASQVLLAGSLAVVGFAVSLASPGVLAALLVPAGFASGVMVPTMTSQVLAAVGREFHGTAAAAFNTLRSAGGAVGVSVFGLLLGGGSIAGFRNCVAGACVALAAAYTLGRMVPESAGERGVRV
jgi:DHA2 family methylenomycin A resistance protein-like MFS transporter